MDSWSSSMDQTDMTWVMLQQTANNPLQVTTLTQLNPFYQYTKIILQLIQNTEII